VQQQQVQQQGPALEDVPAWLDAEVAYHEGDSDADISDVVEVRAVSGQPWDLELQVAGTSRPRRLAALQEAVQVGGPQQGSGRRLVRGRGWHRRGRRAAQLSAAGGPKGVPRAPRQLAPVVQGGAEAPAGAWWRRRWSAGPGPGPMWSWR
jgi:hypothetical protein